MRGGAARARPTAASPLVAFLQAKITRAPAPANARAACSPMPVFAPVTTMVFPERSSPATTSSALVRDPKRGLPVTVAAVIIRL